MQSSDAHQFNDRTTSLGRLPGGPVVDDKVDDAAAVVLVVLDVDSSRPGFTLLELAATLDTVSDAGETFRFNWAVIAAIGRWPGRAGRSFARSLSGVPVPTPISPICGPLGDGLFPSRAADDGRRHRDIRSHVLNQHHQQQSLPNPGREVGRISRHCRGPPWPRRFAVQTVGGRLVDPREEIRSRTSASFSYPSQ